MNTCSTIFAWCNTCGIKRLITEVPRSGSPYVCQFCVRSARQEPAREAFDRLKDCAEFRDILVVLSYILNENHSHWTWEGDKVGS